MTRKLRKQRKTLLIVGEGQTEHAFLKYLVSLFCRDKQGPKVTVENAHGKGPENILNTAIRIKRRASYDKTVAVLDTDIPWTQSLKREARSNNVELVGNDPCIEGLFLRLLGETVPNTTAECKAKLSNIKNLNWLDKRAYETWCNKELLEHHCNEPQKIEELRRLLSFYKG